MFISLIFEKKSRLCLAPPSLLFDCSSEFCSYSSKQKYSSSPVPAAFCCFDTFTVPWFIWICYSIMTGLSQLSSDLSANSSLLIIWSSYSECWACIKSSFMLLLKPLMCWSLDTMCLRPAGFLSLLISFYWSCWLNYFVIWNADTGCTDSNFVWLYVEELFWIIWLS